MSSNPSQRRRRRSRTRDGGGGVCPPAPMPRRERRRNGAAVTSLARDKAAPPADQIIIVISRVVMARHSLWLAAQMGRRCIVVCTVLFHAHRYPLTEKTLIQSRRISGSVPSGYLKLQASLQGAVGKSKLGMPLARNLFITTRNKWLKMRC